MQLFLSLGLLIHSMPLVCYYQSLSPIYQHSRDQLNIWKDGLSKISGLPCNCVSVYCTTSKGKLWLGLLYVYLTFHIVSSTLYHSLWTWQWLRKTAKMLENDWNFTVVSVKTLTVPLCTINIRLSEHFFCIQRLAGFWL